MNPDNPDLAEPYLGGWLSSLGLGVTYVRSAGNTLFYRDDQGEEIAVLDMVGGYGSTILGHNNPELIEYAKSLLDEGAPIHAQFSKHPYANALAQKLNAIIKREFGTPDPYYAVFANSGAEAVEIAVKHAELDRVMKLAALSEDIEANIEKALVAGHDGADVVIGDAPVSISARTSHSPGIEQLVADIREINRERMSAPPVFLAPEGAFHGKLVGSVQLTHNVGFRSPFAALAAQCRFVPVHKPDAVMNAIAREKKTLLDLTVDNGVVRVVERAMPSIGAFILEPIQGEAGIRLFDRAVIQQIQSACAAIDCPIIIDEVQSGVGRSGAFFASSHIGLQGDYYALAKSLGGGIAKAAMTLVRGSRYRYEFELVHSSTYAKDIFSTLIASRTVDLLEAEGGKAYRLAETNGEKLLAMLGRLREEFPTVIKDVRGKGLMVGLEFHDQSDSTSETIREQAREGLLGYFLSGYLMRAHLVRIFPTASATNTLRLEPSVYLTDSEIAQVESALRSVIVLLRDQDGDALHA